MFINLENLRISIIRNIKILVKELYKKVIYLNLSRMEYNKHLRSAYKLPLLKGHCILNLFFYKIPLNALILCKSAMIWFEFVPLGFTTK